MEYCRARSQFWFGDLLADAGEEITIEFARTGSGITDLLGQFRENASRGEPRVLVRGVEKRILAIGQTKEPSESTLALYQKGENGYDCDQGCKLARAPSFFWVMRLEHQATSGRMHREGDDDDWLLEQ